MNNKATKALSSCIYLLAVGSIAAGTVSCKGHLFNKEAVISGVIRNLDDKQLLLLQEESDSADTISVKADGTFRYRFAVEGPSGTYLLYIPETSTPVYLYVRKGARIRIRFDANEPGQPPTLRGNVANECEIVRRMNEAFSGDDPEEIARMSFPEYRKKLIDEYTAVVKLLKKVKDRKFAESALKELTARRDYNLYCYRASYKLYVAPEGDVEDAMFWDFARNIDLNDIANARSGLTELVLVWDMQSAHIERSDLNVLKELARRVSNQEVLDCLSGECMYSALLNETAVESLEETYALFTRICRDPATLQDMEQAYESKITAIRKFGPGKELLDLEMEDRNGTKVNLSSLKGKVRYVDVWASWCGPCRYEMQFLEELAQRYEGDDRLEIVSLSIDTDREAWLQTAMPDRPGWKQYLATPQSRQVLEEEYSITAIPRFMLFDGHNRIIDIHAPSPSDEEEIDRMLQEWLGPDGNSTAKRQP